MSLREGTKMVLDDGRTDLFVSLKLCMQKISNELKALTKRTDLQTRHKEEKLPIRFGKLAPRAKERNAYPLGQVVITGGQLRRALWCVVRENDHVPLERLVPAPSGRLQLDGEAHDTVARDEEALEVVQGQEVAVDRLGTIEIAIVHLGDGVCRPFTLLELVHTRRTNGDLLLTVNDLDQLRVQMEARVEIARLIGAADCLRGPVLGGEGGLLLRRKLQHVEEGAAQDEKRVLAACGWNKQCAVSSKFTCQARA